MVVPSRLPGVSGVDTREDDHGHGGDALAEDSQGLVVSDAEGEFGGAVRRSSAPDENIASDGLRVPPLAPSSISELGSSRSVRCTATRTRCCRTGSVSGSRCGRRHERGTGVVEGEPQTERGPRTLPLDETLAASLRSLKARQAQERLAAGAYRRAALTAPVPIWSWTSWAVRTGRSGSATSFRHAGQGRGAARRSGCTTPGTRAGRSCIFGECRPP